MRPGCRSVLGQLHVSVGMHCACWRHGGTSADDSSGCAHGLPLPSAVRAAACLESLCGSRRTPPTRPPSSCCCQTCRTAWPPPHRSGGAAWRQLVPHGVICSSIAFTTLPAVGPCPSLQSSVLTLCLLNALFLVCHLPVLFCHSQAQQWSEEDRADGELLKAAWPRLR